MKENRICAAPVALSEGTNEKLFCIRIRDFLKANYEQIIEFGFKE
jgi:hypothetical protein